MSIFLVQASFCKSFYKIHCPTLSCSVKVQIGTRLHTVVAAVCNGIHTHNLCCVCRMKSTEVTVSVSILILAGSLVFNPFDTKDDYSGRTAPLTSKRCILYIYSTNIGTEYFKHGIYCPFFPLQNAVCFINLTYLVPVLFTFYIEGVLKLKNNSGAKMLNVNVMSVYVMFISSCLKCRKCRVVCGTFQSSLEYNFHMFNYIKYMGRVAQSV